MNNSKNLVIATCMLCILSSFTARSQDDPVSLTADWASDKGYWIVESNIKSPKEHTIRFFNNEHILVYKESVSGVRLDTDKRRVKMKLKRVLESSALAWQQKKVAEEDKAYVAAILK